jgi:hypothetical protein
MAFGSGKRRRSEDDEDIDADEDIHAGDELEGAIDVEEEEEPPCEVIKLYHEICLFDEMPEPA